MTAKICNIYRCFFAILVISVCFCLSSCKASVLPSAEAVMAHHPDWAVSHLENYSLADIVDAWGPPDDSYMRGMTDCYLWNNEDGVIRMAFAGQNLIDIDIIPTVTMLPSDYRRLTAGALLLVLPILITGIAVIHAGHIRTKEKEAR